MTIPIRVSAVGIGHNVMGGSTVTGWVYLNTYPMEDVVVALSAVTLPWRRSLPA